MANSKPGSENILRDAFGDTVKALRSRTNSLASKSMARFTLLLIAVLGLVGTFCFLAIYN